MIHGANLPEPRPAGLSSRSSDGSPAEVVAKLTNGLFRLRMADGHELVAHVAKDLRKAFTRLLPGDLVEVDVSPFDSGKARIRKRIEPSRLKQTPIPNSQPQQREQS